MPQSKGSRLAVVFQSESGVTLVGGAGFPRGDLTEALALAPEIVAADGGANHLDAAGHTPRAVIGDLDSICPDLRRRLGAVVHHIPEQDSTDLDKCLRAIDAPFLLCLGFLGGRVDHTMAAMASITRHGSARVVLLGPDDVCVLCPPDLQVGLPVGTRVSLFPMGPVTGQSEGLEWPIDGLDFAPQGRIGTSNRLVTSRLRLRMDAPRMLVMLERASLSALLPALARSPDW